MTTRLYYTDSYLATFDARVVDRADEGRRIYLDRTAFYPTSGGQPFDVGTIGGRPVADVVDESDRVAHVLAQPLGETAGTVSCAIDWRRRFDHMQQHTGQHLLSAVLAEMFGRQTVSVHFGAEASSLDLDVETISRDDVAAAEERANEVVVENRPVTVSFEEAGLADDLRKASAREGTLRVVTIDGIDRSACGGTHVRRTGEIGPIFVRRIDRVKKQVRLEFVCGLRAVRRARADLDILLRLAQSLSAALDDVPAIVESQAERLRAADAQRRRLDTELAAHRARALYDATTADALGLRRTIQRRESGSLEELRVLAQAYGVLPRAVFVGSVDDPPAVLLAASDDSGLDAGRTLKAALASVGGRGGGSPRMAQGSVPTPDLVAKVIEAVAGISE
ncbi:MAG: DHHA1 domain-containing protein [Gemmatimonadota bacterium]|nr:DHHA1 domain-containing protein [Gemmatimonadota bacterium]